MAVCKKLDTRASSSWATTRRARRLAARLAHRLGGSWLRATPWRVVGCRRPTASDAGRLRREGDRQDRGVRRPWCGFVLGRWLRPRRRAQRGEVERIKLGISPDTRVRVVSRNVEAKGGARLEDAQLIVSGGRGLGGPEPFKQLQALADAIGAQMAASRAACDAGWVPLSWQVGQTGKKVAPQLYMAIAISGASQHIMGIADSKVICAINRDPDAPIFKHCRFGLVEDYQRIVGPLTGETPSSTDARSPAGDARSLLEHPPCVGDVCSNVGPDCGGGDRYGLFRRVRVWRCGKPEADSRWDRPLERIVLVAQEFRSTVPHVGASCIPA